MSTGSAGSGSHAGFRGALLALLRCWVLFGICLVLAFAVTRATLVAAGVGPEAARSAFKASYSMRPLDPVFERAARAGAPLSVLFMIFNGSATLFLWLLLAGSIPLANHARKDRFPRLIRHIVVSNLGHSFLDSARADWLTSTIKRFLQTGPGSWFVWPFRQKIRRDLQDVYLLTILGPPLLSGGLGALHGMGFAFMLHFVASVAVSAALIVPHGVFEVSALLMPGDFVTALFRNLKPDLVSGGTSEVWQGVRRDVSVSGLARWVPASLALIVAAAFLEAHATVPIARAVAGALGVSGP